MSVQLVDPELDRLKAVVVRDGAIRGAQVASLIAPPAYVANAIRTRQWSINGLLRATALATVLVGPPAGALVAQLRLQSYATKEAVQAKVQALSLDAAQIEAKDFSLIGAAVGSLFTSAVFLRSARLPWLLTGGAGLGVAGGVLAHYAAEYSSSRPLVPKRV